MPQWEAYSPSNQDLDKLVEQLKMCKTIGEADVKALNKRAKKILKEKRNV